MDEVLTSSFYSRLMDRVLNWLSTELPSIVMMIILMVILLKLVSFLTNKIKKAFQKRARIHPEESDSETEKRLTTVLSLFRRVISIILWVIFIMIFLKKFNIDIAPIIAGAGIVGLAIGFGAQELVRDFISGFFMLLEDQIRVGDTVVLNGTSGSVEEIQLRTITLRDSSGTVHIFQNGKISSLSNMTKEWSAMIFNIGVAYKEDLTNVMKIMKDTADVLYNDLEFKHRMLDSIEISGLDSFGDSALIIKARIKTKPGHQWAVGREYRKRLKEAFDLNRIEMPYPNCTIHIEK